MFAVVLTAAVVFIRVGALKAIERDRMTPAIRSDMIEFINVSVL